MNNKVKNKNMNNTAFLSHFLPDVSINQFKDIDALSLTNLKTVNLFTGKNGSGKTSILEAIDEQVIEILGGWTRNIHSRYQGVEVLNLEKLCALPNTEFPVFF